VPRVCIKTGGDVVAAEVSGDSSTAHKMGTKTLRKNRPVPKQMQVDGGGGGGAVVVVIVVRFCTSERPSSTILLLSSAIQ
jgi:hypothetical protein